MRDLHIIIPMAGEGSRFLDKGIKTPKPLIKLEGKYLFERALSSLNEINANKVFTFIIRQNHIDEFNIDIIIKEIYPNANISIVQKTTRGAVETCLLAKEFLKLNEGVIIIDCDLQFYSEEYNNFIYSDLNNENNNIGGSLVSFQSTKPIYSYAATNEDGFVVKTAEKEVISNNALIGSYYFSNSKFFITTAIKLLNESNQNHPEFYVSLLYNYLLKDGYDVKLTKATMYYSYGTPDELQENKNLPNE